MTLTNALYSSVSGLSTSSTSIAVIGDNIANANTPAFKEKRPEFAAVLGQNITAGAGFAQIGAGARVNNIGTLFSQGTFEQTGRTTDIGIEGRGFFVLDNGTARTYTRAGVFGLDANGIFVDSAGNRVQGFGIDPTTGTSNGVLGDIQLDLSLSPPMATTSMELALNLSSDESAIAGGFDPANPVSTSNARVAVTIYDTLGSPRDVTVFFTKTGATTWDYNVALSDADAGTPTGDPFVVQGSGSLTFDSSGNLTSGPGGLTPATINFDLNNSNGSAAAQAVTFSLGPIAGAGTGTPTTHYADDTTTISKSQDGFAPGRLSALEIDDFGRLNGVFTNGVTSTLAQLALANFGNVEGLTDIGNNQLVESVSSGPAILGEAGSGSLGKVRSSQLENSNVDLADQFVKLIIMQRAFQANTRTVSVANELLANLVSLGQ